MAGNRSIVAWREEDGKNRRTDYKGKWGTFAGDGYIHYLNCNGGFMGVFRYLTLKITHF